MVQLVDSKIFATPDAPYIKYLEKISDRWGVAKELEQDLKKLIPIVKKHERPLIAKRMIGGGGSRETIAELLDIQPGGKGRGNTLKRYGHLTSLEGRHGYTIPESTATTNFLHQLQSCEQDVHTRIVVLHSGRDGPGDMAFDSLFFCHVLGVELNLPPGDVRNLAQLADHDNSRFQGVPQSRQRLPMKPGYVSLGFSEESQKRNVAAYIGTRDMGPHAPHVVVVRLQAGKYGTMFPELASVLNILEPPARTGNLLQCRPQPDSNTVFMHAVRRCAQSERSLRPQDLTSSWVSALAFMDGVKSELSIDFLTSQWLTAPKDIDTDGLNHLSQSATGICTSLQTSVGQISAFRRSHPAAKCLGSDEAEHYLDRLLANAKPIAEEIQDKINKRQEKLNLEVSTTALKESRSALALTVLAFIFIPINTASSIFGMNVKEIGESTSIWAFVIIACALTACAGLGWLLWRAPWQKWWKDLGLPVSQERDKAYELDQYA